MRRALRRAAVVAALAVVLAVPCLAGSYQWKQRPTAASSTELLALRERLLAPALDGVLGIPVAGVHWQDDDVDVFLEDGTLFLERPVDGVQVGAYFTGKAQLSFSPRGARAQASLRRVLQTRALNREPVTDVLFWTPGGRSLAAQLKLPETGSLPLSSDQEYRRQKSAFGQLGLDPLHAFLDREGAARGSAYLVFAAPGLRGSRSKEALLLYEHRTDKLKGVGLLHAGNLRVSSDEPNGFMWLTAARLADGAHREDTPVHVEAYDIRVELWRSLDDARETTRLTIRPEAPVAALSFAFDPAMVVSRVVGPEGGDLPFVQWAYEATTRAARPRTL